jgi:two-component system cell cycle response regulator DivK
LVDGAVDEREMYAEWFRYHGYCTLQAANARDGFRLASELKTDVIITDIRLPGCDDGLRLTTRLKTTASTARIPVVVLTGYAGPLEIQAATQAGCDWFVPKPCGPDKLAAIAASLIAKTGQERN